MRARSIVIAALLAAAIVHITPAGAFDLENNLSRSVTGHIVADSNAFNGVAVSAPCSGSGLAVVKCNVVTITNKGTTDETFRVLKETDTGTGLHDFALGSVAAVTSGWTTRTAAVNTGSTATIIVNVSQCTITCGHTFYANFTVEGQKANVLDVNQTRIMIWYTFT